MGAAASGAKNADAWRCAADARKIPNPSSLAYEGVFNEHFFITGSETARPFSASFSPATSKDPINGKWETFLSLGLNSKYDGLGLKNHGGRPSLNFVVLLDVSGSMAASLHDSGSQIRKSKLKLAIESLKILLSKLTPDDSFALVTFDSEAQVLIQLTPLSKLDKRHTATLIDGITTRGSTNLSAGLRCAYEQISSSSTECVIGKTSRVFVLTDDNTNTGEKSAGSLIDIVSSAASKQIFTTTIGVGIDFQTDLAQQLSAVRACNYLSVKTAEAFQRTMDQDFDYLVTPVAFDVVISMQSEVWEVERIFGSPGFEMPGEGGEVVRINSIFPSQKEREDGTKGGVILLQLRPRGGARPDGKGSVARMTVSYEDRDGIVHMDTTEVPLPPNAPVQGGAEGGACVGSFGGPGVRKAVALTRYVNLMKRWAASEMAVHGVGSGEAEPETLESVMAAGARAPPPRKADLGRDAWEGRSVDLHVCDAWRPALATMADHLEQELSACQTAESLLDPSRCESDRQICKEGLITAMSPSAEAASAVKHLRELAAFKESLDCLDHPEERASGDGNYAVRPATQGCCIH